MQELYSEFSVFLKQGVKTVVKGLAWPRLEVDVWPSPQFFYVGRIFALTCHVSYLRDAMTTCPESCCLVFPPYIVIHRAEGYPPPDTYYVDQVKNTLHQIEALDIPSVCESR